MTICFFGGYDPTYSRNRVLKKGLASVGANLIECQGKNLLNLTVNFFKYARKSDVILVAFPGNECVPLAWLLGKVLNKKVVFDAFISRYDTKVFDRKEFSPKSPQALVLFALDYLACFLADRIILDTQQHIDYFVSTFKLPRQKFFRLFVGTDEVVFHPLEKSRGTTLSVGFHGYYIPVQGVETIIKAAKLLEDDSSIVFKLLGNGPDFPKCQSLVKSLKLSNVQFFPPVSYDKLPSFISQTDISLGGPFGSSDKAGRIIPNKVYEVLAMEKCVIVADTKAIRELLTHKENCYMVCRNNPEELAEAIKFLKKNAVLRRKIARNGYNLFKSQLTTREIGKKLYSLLTSYVPSD